MKRLTQEEFLTSAKAVHGELYDYTKTVYVRSSEKVVITCKLHGDFLQTPRDHVHNSAHCPTCGAVSRDEFISRAIHEHGNKYDYSKINYVNTKTPIELECPYCGQTFKQTPSHHMEGRNCPLCRDERIGGSNRKTTSHFIEKAIAVHGGGRYDYSFVDYKSSREQVKIICLTHGDFFQVAGDHLQGYGCQLCANELISKKKKFSTVEFIQKASVTHGNKYDYSLVDYKYSTIKVDIICPEHGVFSQAPSQHWAGSGCPTCAKHGFNSTQAGVLYVVSIQGRVGEFTGYGVTKDYKTRISTHKRFLKLCGYNIVNEWTSCEVPGKLLRKIEDKIRLKFALSVLSENVEGFRTESTPETLISVVDFIQEQILGECCG